MKIIKKWIATSVWTKLAPLVYLLFQDKLKLEQINI